MPTGSIAVGAQGDEGRTPAQWYCLIFGVGLLVIGVLGFLVNGTFADAEFGLDLDDPEDINGDLFLGLEVNGWHNVVHIASGLVLLMAAFARGAAKIAAIAFGVVYAAVAVIGFLDGNDVLEFIVVNTVDNVFHVALALLGLIAGLASKAGGDHAGDARREPSARDTDLTAGRAGAAPEAEGRRFGRAPVAPETHERDRPRR